MQKNSTILNSVWLSGTNDYQQRVPSPSVATQAETARAIFRPENGTIAYNYFVDVLINRIGMTYARSQSWRNPLAPFKRGKLEFGDKVQELVSNWVTAHSYEPDKMSLLKVHRPEVQQAIHVTNRFDQYPISINKLEMRKAFTTEYGLNELVASLMDAVLNSSNYDEFQQMKAQLSYYDQNLGFFKISMPEPTDEDTARDFLTSVRAMVNRLQFPSTLYNAQVISDLPVFARPDELVLICTPEAAAVQDTAFLASVFHLDLAEAEVRQVIIDDFGIPGAYAMLTTEDWFQVYDQVYENSSFFNPETLTTNYYLTIQQVISCSPFVPAIIWTTESGTGPVTITQTTTGGITGAKAKRDQLGNFSTLNDTATPITKAMVTGKNADGTASDVDGVYLFGTLAGTLSDGTTSGVTELDGISVSPDAYIVTGYSYAVVDDTADAAAPVANSRTYVDRSGRLHLQAGAYKSNGGLELTVTIEPAYVNPDGDTPTAVPAEVTFNIAGIG